VYTKPLDAAESLLKPPTSERLKSGYVILKPGEAVGEHTTGQREELLIILAGSARIECEGESTALGANAVAYVPPNSRHNVFNTAHDDLKYVYVVTPVG
jgi:mannose-6-phosphate isomerase-like protein (cupin superfamily)